MSRPIYRPIRSPLISMGPSLDEARRRSRYARMIAVSSITIVVALLVGAWLVSLVGKEVLDGEIAASAEIKAAATPVLPVGPPRPQNLATAILGRDEPNVRLQIPINMRAVTAIGFGQRSAENIVNLQPSGERANLSWGHRMLDRFMRTDPPGDLRWIQLEGGEASTVLVGAAPGTDAYAPINGRVLAITPYIVSGEELGSIIQLQPTGDASTIVMLRGLEADTDLVVGQSVTEGVTQIGEVKDFKGQVQAPLKAFTHDSGSGVEIYVTRTDAPGDLGLFTGS